LFGDVCSETWQESEKGEAFQEVLDRVEEARSAVDDFTLPRLLRTHQEESWSKTALVAELS